LPPRFPSAITYTIQKLEQDLEGQAVRPQRPPRTADRRPAKLVTQAAHLLRAATDLECRVRHVATGWETELRIAVDDLVPTERLFPLLKDFYPRGIRHTRPFDNGSARRFAGPI